MENKNLQREKPNQEIENGNKQQTNYKLAYNGKRLQEINIHKIQDACDSDSSEEGELDQEYFDSYQSKNWNSEVLYKKLCKKGRNPD